MINVFLGVIVMSSLEYFKNQAKLLLKDYNVLKEHNFNQSDVVYDSHQDHFDINNVFSTVGKELGDRFTLMNAQHLVAKLSEFKDWKHLLHASEFQLKIGALKLKAYKIGINPLILERARELVLNEIYADSLDSFIDNQEDFNPDDEYVLSIWKEAFELLLPGFQSQEQR